MFRHLSHRVIIKFRFCLNSVYFLIGFIISFLQLFCKKIHIYSCCNRCRNLSIPAPDSTLRVVFPPCFSYIFLSIFILYICFFILIIMQFIIILLQNGYTSFFVQSAFFRDIMRFSEFHFVISLFFNAVILNNQYIFINFD